MKDRIIEMRKEEVEINSDIKMPYINSNLIVVGVGSLIDIFPVYLIPLLSSVR